MLTRGLIVFHSRYIEVNGIRILKSTVLIEELLHFGVIAVSLLFSQYRSLIEYVPSWPRWRTWLEVGLKSLNVAQNSLGRGPRPAAARQPMFYVWGISTIHSSFVDVRSTMTYFSAQNTQTNMSP